MSNRIYKFRADGNVLKRSDNDTDYRQITSNSEGYSSVSFTFNNEWNGLSKTVVFRQDHRTYERVLTSSNVCTIPKEVLNPRRELQVGVIGSGTVSGSFLKITTNYCFLNIVDGAEEGESATLQPTASVYQQILEIVQDTNDKVDSLSGDTDSTLEELEETLTEAIEGLSEDIEDLQDQIDDKVGKVTGKGLSTNDYTNADKQALGNKVDKVEGKGLSTNDYTTSEKNKLSGIEANANNYTHPSSHPATMIDGLANVAKTGKYGDLSEKPTIPSIAGLATEDYVNSKVAGLLNSDSETLETLHQIADALSEDPEFATTVTTELGNKVDKVEGKGLSTNDYTTSEKTKLAGIAAGATCYNHPATHPASMISGLSEVATTGSYNDLDDVPSSFTPATHNHDDRYYQKSEVDDLVEDKVDKVTGKGLSKNDFTDSYKGMLDSLDDDLGDKVDKVEGKGLSTNDYTTNEKTKLAGLSNYTHPANHPASMITGLSDVATSGSFNDLEDTGDLATKDYVDEKLEEILDSAPETLETLNSLAEALGDDPNYAATIAEELSNKVDKVEGKGLSTNDYTTSEKEKLAGLSNYTHPNNHPASMITGLSEVATSGSYDDLDDVPEAFPPSAHNHDNQYYKKTEAYSKTEIDEMLEEGVAPTSHDHDTRYYKKTESYNKTEINAALSAKASSNHTHSTYYTKSEVDDLLEDFEPTGIPSVSGAEEDNLASFDDEGNLKDSGVSVNSIPDGFSISGNTLSLTHNGTVVGTSVTIPSSGGSGGTVSNYSVRLTNERKTVVEGASVAEDTFTVATTSAANVKVKFSEAYLGTNTGTLGKITIEYKLSSSSNWKTHKTYTNVPQNSVRTYDVSSILTADAVTNVRVTATGGESNESSNSIVYTITQVTLTMETTFEDLQTNVYTESFSLYYRCKGNGINKRIYFMLDGKTYAVLPSSSTYTTSHDVLTPQTMNIAQFCADNNLPIYGAHELQVYFVSDAGAYSNICKYIILYDNNSGVYDTMIGAFCTSDYVQYGTTLSAKYIIHTPGEEVTDKMSIRVYSLDNNEEIEWDSKEEANVSNKAVHEFTTEYYPDEGTVYVEFSIGGIKKTVSATISPYETTYEIDPVETGLVYEYNANGRSNTAVNRATYVHDYATSNGLTTHIKGVNSNFNWVSNGYLDGSSLTINGDAKHTIQLPILSPVYTDDENQLIKLDIDENSNIATTGRTIEFEYKVDCVTDIDAPIIKCMSTSHAGFEITPQSCYLLYSNGPNVIKDSTGFILDESSIACAYLRDGNRIRVSFVIEPLKSHSYVNSGNTIYKQFVNIYINGQYANSLAYPDNAVFGNTEYIQIGSSTCITNLYEVRIYNRGLNQREILQNYQTSPIAIRNRVTRIEENDFLDTNGNLDYEKAKKKYNCLLITGQLSPYKGADGIHGRDGKYESGLTLTKPNGRGGFITEFDLLDKDANGVWTSSNNVQGTSSVKFPVKNYKIYLARNTYNNGVVTGSTKVKYSLKGYPTPQWTTVGDSKYPSSSSSTAYSIPESTLCWKADYMSTNHANTYNANLAGTVFTDKTEPQTGEDNRVQNTVYGIRCLLFQRDDIGEAITFIGDGSLNNDKSNSDTFGLKVSGDSGNVTTRQKWEFLNNTEALCSFQTDRLQGMTVDEEGNPILRALAGLESTYPDQGDLEDEDLSPNYDYIQVLFTWVCQRANFWDETDPTERAAKKAIFKSEFSKHFNVNHALTYYLFMEFTALCDNRAKNMFLQCFDVTEEDIVFTDNEVTTLTDIINYTTGEVDASKIDWENSTFAKWYPVLYDLDSCFGVENSGYLQIPYYADWNYERTQLKADGTTMLDDNSNPIVEKKFNGHGSRLWLMVEEAFASELKSLAQTITNRTTGYGALNYDALTQFHIVGNQNSSCPATINQDMLTKYVNPLIDGFIDYSIEGNPLARYDYLYMLRGNRTEQQDAFMYRRCNMLYSKYSCDKFMNNNINFRCGVSGELNGLPATDSSIAIKASQVIYPAVKFADGTGAAIIATGPKTSAGTVCSVRKPGTSQDKVGFSDTVYIGGATLLTDIGDISKFKPYEVQLQNAKNLRKLLIGSSTVGYSNPSLNALDVSACRLLEEIDVRGCVSLSSLDLSQNTLIKKVYATNTEALTHVSFAEGGLLETFTIDEPSDIVLINQSHLSNFTCTSYDELMNIRIVNTPVEKLVNNVATTIIDITSMVINATNLNRVRIEGAEWTTTETNLMSMVNKLKNLAGYDSAGNNASKAYLSGVVTVPSISSANMEIVNTAFPDLSVRTTVNGQLTTLYVVRFLDYDRSTQLSYQVVASGANANLPTNPTRTSTDPDIIYNFKEWLDGSSTASLNNITNNKKFIASYYADHAVRFHNAYTNDNGTAVDNVVTVAVRDGNNVSYSGATITRPSDKYQYVFTGEWLNTAGNIITDQGVYSNVTSALDLYAQYEDDPDPVPYTITYVVGSYGSLAESGYTNNNNDTFSIVLGYGTTIPEPTPSRSINGTDVCSFQGWLTHPATVPANSSHTITVESAWTLVQFNITYKNKDGGTIGTDTYTVNSTNFLRTTSPAVTGYSFTGWNVAVASGGWSAGIQNSVNCKNMYGNISVQATYSIDQYTITFNTHSGTSIRTITQNYGTVIARPSTTRTGYTFSGWYEGYNSSTGAYSTPSDIPSTMPARDMTLHAKWTINQYTITFDSNDGSSVSAITQDYASVVTAPVNPTKRGHTFGGWYTDDDTFANAYNFSTMPAANITLHAKWILNKYKVNFKNPDGSVIYWYMCDYGTVPAYIGNTPTYDNAQYTWVFANAWSTTNDNTADTIVPMTDNETSYYAVYNRTIKSYEIKFVNYDDTELQVETLQYGVTPEYSGETPTRDPSNHRVYTFSGWTPSISVVGGTATYKAAYSEEVEKVTVTFKDWKGDVIETQTVDYGTNATPPFVDRTVKVYTGLSTWRDSNNRFRTSGAKDYYCTFQGWSENFRSITADTEIQSVYFMEDTEIGIKINDYNVEAGSSSTTSGAKSNMTDGNEDTYYSITSEGTSILYVNPSIGFKSGGEITFPVGTRVNKKLLSAKVGAINTTIRVSIEYYMDSSSTISSNYLNGNGIKSTDSNLVVGYSCLEYTLGSGESFTSPYSASGGTNTNHQGIRMYKGGTGRIYEFWFGVGVISTYSNTTIFN